MQSFSARDLRRTFKTLAGSMSIPLEMRNRLQGHALVDVGSVYYDRYRLSGPETGSYGAVGFLDLGKIITTGAQK